MSTQRKILSDPVSIFTSFCVCLDLGITEEMAVAKLRKKYDLSKEALLAILNSEGVLVA